MLSRLSSDELPLGSVKVHGECGGQEIHGKADPMREVKKNQLAQREQSSKKPRIWGDLGIDSHASFDCWSRATLCNIEKLCFHRLQRVVVPMQPPK